MRPLVGVGLAAPKLGGSSTAANSAPQPISSTPVGAETKDKSTKGEEGLPKHIAYPLFFGEMMVLKKKASERERQVTRAMRCAIFISYAQISALMNRRCWSTLLLSAMTRLSNSTIKRERLLTAKERGIPQGRLKEGEALPVPPAELFQLEEQRKQTLLEAREQLRTRLDQKDFDRIDGFIQQDIEARTKGSSRRKQE